MSTANASTDAPWIALDIGGANIKVAHSEGAARTVPFEVWKRPDELAGRSRRLVAALPPSDRAAVTMTAELCDCYPTKAVGVNAVLDAVVEVCPDRSIVVWGVDGEFHSMSPRSAATATGGRGQLAGPGDPGRRGLLPRAAGLLIDIGTTTTDLIPLDRGKVAARGRSDTERLQTGELVYAGVRRTPVCALATESRSEASPPGWPPSSSPRRSTST